jgi:formamidopyrimidine-DNA glycosylase
MPELPEVEVLARHLRRALRGKSVRAVCVNRAKVLHPTSERELKKVLVGRKFKSLARRGKYLLFDFQDSSAQKIVTVLGHLGMTGKMFVAEKSAPLPKHAAVVLELNEGRFVYEDTRYFGRFTLDLSSVEKLGPEPDDKNLTPEMFWRKLKSSRQPVKVKLLDQSLLAGVGNIYASEALFRAKISPKLAAKKLSPGQAQKLLNTVRAVLREAIDCGSTIPLNFADGTKGDGLFYFGRAADAPDFYEERLRVYDRAGQPCIRCGTEIRRIVQAARSTFFCPRCQR